MVAAVAVAAITPVLAACEAGAGAQTSQPYVPTDGNSTVLHDIAIRNVFILGPAPGQTLPAGGPAGMFLALVNDGAPDRLLQVAAPGTASAVTLPQGAVTLRTSQPALLTGPAPQVILRKLTRPLTAGQSIPMILYFQNAGTININVPVVQRSGYYTTFSPASSPTPTLRPTPGPTLRPTPGATSTPRVAPGGLRSPAPTATPTR